MRSTMISRAPLCLAAACLIVAASARGQEGGSGQRDAKSIVSAVCMVCHGEDGNSVAPIFPSLAGQQRVYLEKQLHDFKSERRHSDVMAPAIATIERSDIPQLAAYFAAQRRAPAPAEDPTLVERGRRLYESGNLNAGVPACGGCHEAQAEGDARYPRLAGQMAAYSRQTLSDFKSGARRNDAGRVMRNIAALLDDADVQALSAYLATK
jgi:cytochrome c553